MDQETLDAILDIQKDDLVLPFQEIQIETSQVHLDPRDWNGDNQELKKFGKKIKRIHLIRSSDLKRPLIGKDVSFLMNSLWLGGFPSIVIEQRKTTGEILYLRVEEE